LIIQARPILGDERVPIAVRVHSEPWLGDGEGEAALERDRASGDRDVVTFLPRARLPISSEPRLARVPPPLGLVSERIRARGCPWRSLPLARTRGNT